MTKTETATAKVIPLRPAKSGSASEKKWGAEVVKLGFCIVPSLLLRAQRRLRVNTRQLAVLLQLCDFWWDEARKPYPSKETIGERLGIGPRQVQRIIASLEEKGFVQRVERRALHGARLTNTYDLSGLVKRLKEIEPEFREVEEEARSRRKAVARPGLRRRAKALEWASPRSEIRTSDNSHLCRTLARMRGGEVSGSMSLM